MEQLSAPNRALYLWLIAVCGMIFAMAVIGAVTRLTESGLSMAEWKPLIGWIPPLTVQEWERVYDLYRAGPEFQARHFWMEIDDFKRIFFWEWLHRLWGRMIGLAYAIPLLWFAVRRRIPCGYGLPLFGFLLLGGLQGFVGWWMVKSGLADRPDVSHFRLAAHLALALFAGLWWTALGLRSFPETEERPGERAKRALLHGAIALLFLAVTLIWGAFTAGLDAGKIYNSFPLMNGHLFPSESFQAAALLDGPGWVQWTHRLLALTTGALLFAFALRRRDMALGAMVCVQIGLGIGTLLSHVFIPLAALHQAGAIVLLALTLGSLHKAGRASLSVNRR